MVCAVFLQSFVCLTYMFGTSFDFHSGFLFRPFTQTQNTCIVVDQSWPSRLKIFKFSCISCNDVYHEIWFPWSVFFITLEFSVFNSGSIPGIILLMAGAQTWKRCWHVQMFQKRNKSICWRIWNAKRQNICALKGIRYLLMILTFSPLLEEVHLERLDAWNLYKCEEIFFWQLSLTLGW